MFEIKGKYTTAIIYAEEIDETCINQIHHFISHPAFTNRVVIMPDTHSGTGSVIGFTMEKTDKIIPNVIGVDGDCGMLFLEINKDEINRIDLKTLDEMIREQIPFGTNVHNSPLFDKWEQLKWFKYDYNWFKKKCKQIGIDLEYAECSLGTLGGGNHFIEIGVSEKTGKPCIIIHSGSRNFGKKICEYHQNIAEEDINKPKKEFYIKEINRIKSDYKGKEIEHNINKLRENLFVGNVPNDLSFLQDQHAKDYLDDMGFIELYAHYNRALIMKTIKNLLNTKSTNYIETVHNYINPKDNIIRKGAISSYIGQKMVIPLNMRDGILLCEGKSNPDWNYSAPHGAGRLLSREQAKATLKLEKFEKDMKGIYSTSVCASTLDESPDAYKDSALTEMLIEPTATVIDKFKPILSLKDRSDNQKSWKEIRQERKENKNKNANN